MSEENDAPEINGSEQKTSSPLIRILTAAVYAAAVYWIWSIWPMAANVWNELFQDGLWTGLSANWQTPVFFGGLMLELVLGATLYAGLLLASGATAASDISKVGTYGFVLAIVLAILTEIVTFLGLGAFPPAWWIILLVILMSVLMILAAFISIWPAIWGAVMTSVCTVIVPKIAAVTFTLWRSVANCVQWSVKTYKECASWGTRTLERCTKWVDQSYKSCSNWGTTTTRSCRRWLPAILGWLCLGWNVIVQTICVAWVIVALLVCVAFFIIVELVCLLFVLISLLVCLIWSIIVVAINIVLYVVIGFLVIVFLCFL